MRWKSTAREQASMSTKGLVLATTVQPDVGQVSDLPFFPGTRPGPLFDRLPQSHPHRIPLNILHDPLKLLPIANPMIVGFILPKPQPRSTQDEVRLSSTSILHSTSDLPQRPMRLQ